MPEKMPKQESTPKKMAEMMEKRADTIEELRDEDAKYVMTEKDKEPRLQVTKEQAKKIGKEPELFREIEDSLPIGKKFKILFMPGSSSSGLRYSRANYDAKVEKKNGEYILKMNSGEFPIERVSSGLDGRVVTIQTKSKLYDKYNYFYTNVAIGRKDRLYEADEYTGEKSVTLLWKGQRVD